jgi:dihydrofolate synthase/folylpolyglutamate synthase
MNKLKSESLRPSPESLSIEEHLAALYGRINYERQDRISPKHFKLRNMREILKRLDNPHLKYPVVHVAGTKGKGSVSTMIGQILSASGRKTGVYTSPHLETLHQRMVVDGVQISDDLLIETLRQIWPVVDEMDQEADKNGYRHLTFFEITTTAAFLFFANQNCDAIVLEVGLGGRLDSTNVCQPITSVITNISLDHTRQLGSTVDKIAFEKAGIIKPTIPVVSGSVDPKAAKVIAEVAASHKSPLFVLDDDFEIVESTCGSDRPFDCVGCFESIGEASESKSSHRFSVDRLELNIIGHHQRTNAAIAVAAIQTLNARDWKIENDAIRTGLSRASLSGRAEVVSRKPTVIIDMAHNVASINALVSALTEDLPEWKSSSKRTLILATSRDKDATGMLTPLVASFDEIILTQYQDNPRGKSESDLLSIATEIQLELRANSLAAAELTTESDPESAWQLATRDLKDDQLVCITGSAFLVAELRKTILLLT